MKNLHITKTPLDDAVEFIRSNKNLFPLEIDNFVFQIRINAHQWKELYPKYRDKFALLYVFCDVKEAEEKDKYLSPDQLKRWKDEHYWELCDSYIFDFSPRNSYVVHKIRAYTDERLAIFVDEFEYPRFILDNIGINERDELIV